MVVSRLSNLEEMDVINATCRYLEESGWKISDRVRHVNQHGTDITAQSPSGRQVLIEAKGGRSSDRRSARRKSGFSSSQLRHHLAVALLKSCEAVSDRRFAAIALPDVKRDQNLVRGINPVLVKLGIPVFLVDEAKRVRVVGAPLPR